MITFLSPDHALMISSPCQLMTLFNLVSYPSTNMSYDFSGSLPSCTGFWFQGFELCGCRTAAGLRFIYSAVKQSYIHGFWFFEEVVFPLNGFSQFRVKLIVLVKLS
jgi:hypothetical protein